MLIYIKNNLDSWSLNSNPNNIISEYTLTIMNHTPKLILLTGYYIILIACIISIWKNNRIKRIILYPVALLMLTIGIKITGNLLCFEDYTNLWLMTIYHPIPLETKQYYLLMQLESIIHHSLPDIYIKPELLKWITDQVSKTLANTNWELFKYKTPNEITQYAYELLNIEPPENRYTIQVIQGIITLSIIKIILF